ncbi:hypothetical protein Scep_013068 [Stephania cephalantha]|uniref:Late embryogenesis abundant protein LEA-2 subgroup domain-containing protein n=1 Tax=Stephania cephalantha TaxID=152367 RepID=A0AAP0PA88_9MAGN
MSEPSSCRFRCCSFIFSLGLSALFLWLSLRPSKPTFSIESFYVPALNKTASADQRRNTTLVFDLLLKNRNKDSGVFYDQLNLTVYHGGNLALPVANLTIPAFRQGKKKKAHRVENVTAVGVPWEEARRAAAAAAGGGGGAVFGVGVATAVRYRIVFWKTMRYRISLAGNVTVNDLGVKSTEGGVKLSSSSSSLHMGVVVMVVLGIFVNSLFSF